MKVLVIYCTAFSYLPAIKTLPDSEDIIDGMSFTDCVLALIQIEEDDEKQEVAGREKKLVNHLKWSARKNSTSTIVLHSFAHLSDSKASADYTKTLFDMALIRLQNGGYTAAQTPFGYFLDLNIKAPGYSLARIWATL